MFKKLLFFANTFAKFANTEFKAIISALDSALQEESEAEFRVKLRKMEQLFSDAIVSLPNNSKKRAALMAAAVVIDNIRNGTVARFGPDGEPRMIRITLGEAKEQVSQVRNGLFTRIFKPEEEFEIDEVGKINEPDESRDKFTFDMSGEEASWFQVASIETAVDRLYKEAVKKKKYKDYYGNCKKCGQSFKLTSTGLIPYHDSDYGNPSCPGSQDSPVRDKPMTYREV